MLTLLALALALPIGVFSDPIVRVGDTDVIGSDIWVLSSPVEFFGGIPFAEPPLGDLRLSLPVLRTSLGVQTFKAQNFGPGCLQVPVPPSGASEDCLSLDIYRPSGVPSNAKLPVLVWIYGGGFVVGASSSYNASDLVARSVSRGTPMIVVSINYRLGPLGFPQGIEAGQKNLLNLGLYDQIAALEWIQENIGSFGGDKTKVTISGQSAGALSIVILMLQSRIKALARGAIIESTAIIPIFGPERNEPSWQLFASAIPACSTAAGSSNSTFDCIRRADSASLEQALISNGITFANSNFRPVIEGPNGLIVDRISKITPQGSLPSLMGSNLDEATLVTEAINATSEIVDSIVTQPPTVSQEQVAAFVAEALELYPDAPALGSPFGTGNNTFGLNREYKRAAAIIGDMQFQAARRLQAQKMSQAGVPVFAYLFTDHDAIPVPEFAPDPPATPGSLGVTHTAEIPYVFGMLLNKTASASALSTVIQDYWISFVSSLNPNDIRGEKRPHWTQYTPHNQVLMELNGQKTALIRDTYRAKQINFWLDDADVVHR